MIRLALAVFLAAPAFAGEQSYIVNSPLTPMPFDNLTVAVPQFVPTVGRLDRVRVSANVYIEGTLSIENIDSQPTQPMSPGSSCSAYYYPYASAFWAYGGFIPFGGAGTSDNAYCVPVLGAFDGTIDYAGPSGVVTSFGPVYGNGVTSEAAPPNLATLDAFSGFGTTQLYFQATPGIGSWSAPQYALSMSGTVVVWVTYYYSDYPSEFCYHASQGAGHNPCPCETYGTGYGCPNSQNANGARLQFAGHSSLSADDFVITATGLPPQAICLFFQGTNRTFLGSFFGDGTRCVIGTIARLGIKSASAGVASYPGTGDLPISVIGQVPAAGSLRAYQVWYRDPVPFCTSATHNLSSAVLTLWTP